MTIQKKFIIIIFGIISIFLAAVSAFLLIRGVQTEYDAAIGHFSADAVFAPIAFVLMILGTVLGIVPAFLMKGVKADSSRGAGIALSFVSVFAGALILASSVFGFFDSGVELSENYRFLSGLGGVVGIAGAVAMLIFAMSGAFKTRLSRMLSMLVPLYFIIRVLLLYFDSSGAVNSTAKMATQTAFIAFALLATFDAGMYIGREILRRYIFGAIFAVSVGLPVGIAALITQFTIPGCFNLSVVDTCMVCGFAAYSAVKLFHLALSLKDAEHTDEKDVEVSDEQ